MTTGHFPQYFLVSFFNKINKKQYWNFSAPLVILLSTLHSFWVRGLQPGFEIGKRKVTSPVQPSNSPSIPDYKSCADFHTRISQSERVISGPVQYFLNIGPGRLKLKFFSHKFVYINILPNKLARDRIGSILALGPKSLRSIPDFQGPIFHCFIYIVYILILEDFR